MCIDCWFDGKSSLVARFPALTEVSSRAVRNAVLSLKTAIRLMSVIEWYALSCATKVVMLGGTLLRRYSSAILNL